jgi:hypothetical protein
MVDTAYREQEERQEMDLDTMIDLADREVEGTDGAAVTESGCVEEALIIQAMREIRHAWITVLCWQEAGRPATPPLTAAEVGVLQARARGEGPDGQALPPYLIETYQAACLWYYRTVRPASQGIRD